MFKKIFFSNLFCINQRLFFIYRFIWLRNMQTDNSTGGSGLFNNHVTLEIAIFRPLTPTLCVETHIQITNSLMIYNN